MLVRILPSPTIAICIDLCLLPENSNRVSNQYYSQNVSIAPLWLVLETTAVEIASWCLYLNERRQELTKNRERPSWKAAVTVLNPVHSDASRWNPSCSAILK